MKKLLACLTGVLLLFSIAATPVYSTEVISENPAIVMIDNFYTASLTDLMKATHHLKDGDTLHLYTQGPGGNSWVCMSMINYLEGLRAKGVYITCESMGMAASANFFVMLAADERISNKGDMLMSHLVIPRNAYGNKISRDQLTDEQNMITDHLNHWIRQKLLDILGDTELVNDMLDEDNNWFTAEAAYKLGIINKLK